MSNLKETIKGQALEQLRKLTVYNWVMIAFTIIIVVLGLALQPLYLLLLVLLALAGPMVREVGLADERDERVTFISYRSSHIAFYITLLAIAAVFIGRTLARGREIEPEFFILLIVPVAFKLLAALGFTYDARMLGLVIGYTTGVLIAVLEVVRSGYAFTPQMFIPLLIILVTVVGHWYHKLSGSLFLLLGIGYLVMITRDFAMEPGVTPLATPLAFILQAIALGVPVLLAGLLLLFYRRMGGASSTDFNEETPEETAQVG
jgi:hypothetical protein